MRTSDASGSRRRPGPIATSTARVSSRAANCARAAHAQLDVQVVGPAGEQLDQPGRGVLGEQAGRGHPQQPAAAAGLADLEDGAVLQAQHLGGPAGQPQPARA